MKRRHFLGAGLAAGGATWARAAFPERAGEARMHLGLAAYSFRSRFAFSRGKAQEVQGKPMTMQSFIDYCAEQRCGAELTSYFFPPEANDEYFRTLKRHAFLRGVPVCGTAIGNDFSRGDGKKLTMEIEKGQEWLRRAAVMGAPHVRFFAGTAKGFGEDEGRINRAVWALKECARTAAEQGVFIGIENHGGISAELLLRLVKECESPWIGINLDSGNFVSDDPYGDFARCAPLAVNIQMKVHMRDKKAADFPRLVGSLKKTNYSGYVVLEYENDKPDEEIPKYLAELRALL